MKKVIFVSGVSRSGTSAMVSNLNKHPKLLIGSERYYWPTQSNSLNQAHFDRSRFCSIQEGDTHSKRPLPLRDEQLFQRFDEAEYIGDKYPNLFRHFGHIFKNFETATHIYIFRNPLSVIESWDVRHQNPTDGWQATWQEGFAAWNKSIHTVANLPSEIRNRFILVKYETIFSSPAGFNKLFSMLGLSRLPSEVFEDTISKSLALNTTQSVRRDDLRAHVSRYADWESYRELCKREEAIS